MDKANLDDLAGGAQAGTREEKQAPLLRMAEAFAFCKWYMKLIVILICLAVPLAVSSNYVMHVIIYNTRPC